MIPLHILPNSQHITLFLLQDTKKKTTKHRRRVVENNEKKNLKTPFRHYIIHYQIFREQTAQKKHLYLLYTSNKKKVYYI
jgi:hypothetical protein